MRFEFSTAHLPEGLSDRQRFQGFCDVFLSVFNDLEIWPKETPFSGAMGGVLLDSVAIASMDCDIRGGQWGGTRAKPKAGDRFGFMINRGARAVRVRHRGRDEWIAPRGGMLIERTILGETLAEDATNSAFLVELDRRQLLHLARRSEDWVGRAIAPDNESLFMLNGYASTICAGEPRRPELISLASRSIVEMVAMALGECVEAADLANDGAMRTSRAERIMKIIAARFAEPEFSAADVAARLDLSERRILEILHEDGPSFSERVLELRLRRASELLGGAAGGKRKITDVALACGFNDISYFNRVFRRRFGMTPSDARRN